MRPEYKLTLASTLAIILLDIVSSSLEHLLKFRSLSLALLSILVYFLASYRAARYLNCGSTIAFGAFLGLVDSTIGWRICTWICGDVPGSLARTTLGLWWEVVILMMAFGAFISLLAFFIASSRKKQNMS